MVNTIRLAWGVVGLLTTTVGQAASLDGAGLGVGWAIPFVGLLLSIALCPLCMPVLWHHHYGKITAGWSLLFLLPFSFASGMEVAATEVIHAMLAEYLPFLILLAALFVVAGGICIRSNVQAGPAVNTGILALGTVLASIVGTTGAAMLLIRPLIRANRSRRHNAHVIVFFIFLVANAGGALTPLGDPPLFLGFLKGVTFFWTMTHILSETLFLWSSLLVLFYLIDAWYARQPGEKVAGNAGQIKQSLSVAVDGKINFLLLLVIILLVLMSGLWQPGVVLLNWMGTEVALQNAVRDILLLIVLGVSLWITPRSVRHDNGFSWGPMAEVARLFAGIFIVIIPVIAMLRAGSDGAFASVLAVVTKANGQPDDVMYFWVTGLLSSFLDNAPTYLVFFHAASGHAAELMTTLASTLGAISMGAVFMGANTYIGNAPNLMVRAIAEEQGIRMPTFFGYMGWSVCILIPLFVIMTFIFMK